MNAAMNDSAPATASKLTRHWSELVRDEDMGGGPEWLQALRSGAAKEFLANGLPGKKDEAWKYTSLRRLEEMCPVLGSVADVTGTGDWSPLVPRASEFGFRVVDGTLQWLEPETPEGVSMMALADVIARPTEADQACLRPLLEAVDIGGRGRAFEALNTALLRDGVIIRVAAGVDAGLCMAQWRLGSGTTSRLENFRVIIVLEAGARLRLFEQFHGAEPVSREPAKVPRNFAGQALNLMLQAQLAADATLEHVRLQREASTTVLFTFNEVQQAESSRYSYNGYDVGGGLVRHGINCRLAGPGAHAEINGAFVLDHERHVDHHICVDHLAPSCSSEQFFRGVMGGRSRGVFNGKAIIRPGADGSKVRQSNANLLLSEQAEIDTKPELEIYADEVEASHGATVGALDDQAVFYLRSRGLAKTVARRILTAAFCRTVTDRLQDREMAEQIAALLDVSMPEIEPLTEDKSH